jgi:hypothetical protein
MNRAFHTKWSRDDHVAPEGFAPTECFVRAREAVAERFGVGWWFAAVWVGAVG